MARQDPQAIDEQIKKQEAMYEDSGGLGTSDGLDEPMNTDEMMREVTPGEEEDDEIDGIEAGHDLEVNPKKIRDKSLSIDSDDLDEEDEDDEESYKDNPLPGSDHFDISED